MRTRLIKRRPNHRRRVLAKREARLFCPCELCRLRYGRMLYPKAGGNPITGRRIK
jgi:hypothetical protein